jgi:hypothetical protein
VSFDVFKEADSRSNNPNCSPDVWPKVAGIVGSLSLTCRAEGLAGITGHKDVHSVAKLLAWEGFNIRPDRCCVQESRFHFCDQVRAGESFDLTISDDAQIWDCSFKSEMNASVSGAPFNHCNVLGSIHIICPFYSSPQTSPPTTDNIPAKLPTPRSHRANVQGCRLLCTSL